MPNKLEPCEFVNYALLDDIMFEGAEGLGWHNKIVKPVPDAETVKHEENLAVIKPLLIDFIIKQLPNVRLQSSRLSLGDFVRQNGGDFKAAIMKQEYKPWFHMLCASVRSWLQSQNQDQVISLLKPFGGNTTQLVDSVAQEVTNTLQHGVSPNATN